MEMSRMTQNGNVSPIKGVEQMLSPHISWEDILKAEELKRVSNEVKQASNVALANSSVASVRNLAGFSLNSSG